MKISVDYGVVIVHNKKEDSSTKGLLDIDSKVFNLYLDFCEDYSYVVMLPFDDNDYTSCKPQFFKTLEEASNAAHTMRIMFMNPQIICKSGEIIVHDSIADATSSSCIQEVDILDVKGSMLCFSANSQET